ncbi:glycosyltransferase [Evansella vedderi]|nr:glycosyltransferase [Evansella vedderi]
MSTLERSGPINILYNTIKYIDRTMFNVKILTLSPEKSNSAIGDFSSLGIEVVSLNMSRIKGAILGSKHLVEYVKKYKPDIIHTHGYRADILSSKYLKKFNRCTTMHNYPFYDFVMTYGKYMGNLMARKQVRALKKIDRAIACSQTIKDEMVKHGLNTLVVQNGVDKELFKVVKNDDKNLIKKKLKLPLDKKIFISVGHLNMRKDPKTLIKGYLKSKAKDDGILLMLGSGPLIEECKEIAIANSEVLFLGHVNNVKEYLNGADYFISSSLAEGLPNSVLEALASSLPVCLSDIPSHNEILNINNNAGYCFKTEDIDDLTKKLNLLIEQDSEFLSAQAVSIIDNKLNAENMSKSYQSIYLDIIEKKFNKSDL